jgi:hypothetical protein
MSSLSNAFWPAATLSVLLAHSSVAGEAAAASKAPEPATRVKRGSQGEVIVTVDQATQKLMGLETAPLAAAQLKPEVKGYGRVLDISPLAGLVAELTTDQAANEASQAELKRLQTLAAQSNSSERDLQRAAAAAARDEAQVAAARLRLLAIWGSAIAQRQDLPGFVQTLSSLTGALVQLDVPAGQPIRTAPTGARLLALADDSHPIEAQFLGPAPAVDPQMQGRGFFFLVQSNFTLLTPGTAVRGFISLPGESHAGVAVPRRAILRFNGATWIYFQTSAETFQRTEVALQAPLNEGWFVGQGLKPQDKVVTVGAQQLLSEELKGPEGE